LPNPNFGNQEFVRKKAVGDQKIFLKIQEQTPDLYRNQKIIWLSCLEGNWNFRLDHRLLLPTARLMKTKFSSA
jgi:hypothetical protein